MSVFLQQKWLQMIGLNFNRKNCNEISVLLFAYKKSQIKFAHYSVFGIITSNNTPQASLPVHRRDAQTGGLLISGVGNAL